MCAEYALTISKPPNEKFLCESIDFFGVRCRADGFSALSCATGGAVLPLPQSPGEPVNLRFVEAFVWVA
ncbi:MAG TPA: hypothetical protein VK165_08965, partial [Azonexus sp.]|nr:hypothetical protein [Azonexus sp.]